MARVTGLEPAASGATGRGGKVNKISGIPIFEAKRGQLNQWVRVWSRNAAAGFGYPERYSMYNGGLSGAIYLNWNDRLWHI